MAITTQGKVTTWKLKSTEVAVKVKESNIEFKKREAKDYNNQQYQARLAIDNTDYHIRCSLASLLLNPIWSTSMYLYCEVDYFQIPTCSTTKNMHTRSFSLQAVHKQLMKKIGQSLAIPSSRSTWILVPKHYVYVFIYLGIHAFYFYLLNLYNNNIFTYVIILEYYDFLIDLF